MSERITVQAAGNKGPDGERRFDNSVVFFEVAEGHPNGEALVYAKEGKTFEVARTAKVSQLLESGRLKMASRTAPAATTESTDTAPAAGDSDVEAFADDKSLDELRTLAEERGVTIEGRETKTKYAQALKDSGADLSEL